jgi:hypothetical protein
MFQSAGEPRLPRIGGVGGPKGPPCPLVACPDLSAAGARSRVGANPSLQAGDSEAIRKVQISRDAAYLETARTNEVQSADQNSTRVATQTLTWS